MTKPKSDPRYHPMPISSFDPRYRELLLRGAREEIVIPCGSTAKAHRLQMIICQFRKRVQEENPDNPGEWEPLYGCVVGKTDDKRGLRLFPRQGEFDDVLGAIDKDIPEAAVPHLTHDPLEDL